MYIVVSKNCSLNTYKIRHPVNGRVRTVHRNLLMPVNFLPLPAWGDSVNSECNLSSICNSSSTDLQKSDTADRTSQWIADLGAVVGREKVELSDLIHSSEHGTYGLEVERQTEHVEGAECQDISDSISSTSLSVYMASNDETSFMSDVQNVDSVSQTVTPAVDNVCDVSAVVSEMPMSSSQDATHSGHNAIVSGEQQGPRTRFGRLIKPVCRLIQTMSSQRVRPALEV